MHATAYKDRLTMISAHIATIIVLAFIVIFGMGVPILDKRVPKYISYRWCVVVVVLALLIGVVVDFGELPQDIRRAVVVGGLVIAGAYIVLRTIEKTLANGWLHGASIEAKKGDISVKVTGSSETK